MIDEQVDRIRKQYGKLVSKSEIGKNDEIRGTFKNEEAGIDHKTTLELEKIKNKKAIAALSGKKVGDTIPLKTKGLFKEDYLLAAGLGIPNEQAGKLDIEVNFTVEEISERQPAELNQELFDKLFGKDEVKSEKELREKIKSDSEKQFEQQADQKLLNDVTERLIETTSFDLPAAFLKKWIQMTGEKQLSPEEAQDEYEKSEKGLRYQLIEGKIIKDHNIELKFEELKEYTRNFIRSQMAQYGQLNPAEEELDSIAARVLGNRDEVKRLSEQLMSQKLLSLYKEKGR